MTKDAMIKLAIETTTSIQIADSIIEKHTEYRSTKEKLDYLMHLFGVENVREGVYGDMTEDEILTRKYTQVLSTVVAWE